jgi:hypothetical protein
MYLASLRFPSYAVQREVPLGNAVQRPLRMPGLRQAGVAPYGSDDPLVLDDPVVTKVFRLELSAKC